MAIRSVSIASPLDCANLAELFHSSRSHSMPLGHPGASVSGLVRPLLELGLELRLFTTSLDIDRVLVFEGPNVILTVVPERSDGVGRDGRRWERYRLREVMSGHRTDVTHAQWTYEYALAALSNQKSSIITVRDWAPKIFRHDPHPYNMLRIGMQTYVLARAKYLTANSPYISQRLRRFGRDNVPVIPNAVPEENFKWGARFLNRERPTITTINNGFSHHKNVRSLLKAFSKVRRVRPCHLLLVGRGYELDGVAQRWAMANGFDEADEDLTFAGFRSHGEVLELVENADLVVHPSLVESFGMVLIEAMAAATPVIGGHKSGAVPWVLDYGRAGALTDVRDAEALADTIIHLLSHPSEWQQFSEAGRLRAWNRFRVSVVAARYLKEYEMVLAQLANSS